MLTLGSLFDGSGGFPLAGAINGITPVWSSEIEAYPLRVTAARFPNVPQLGSVLEINGGEIRPANIVTFGSPCQDLSVAGKQKGIHDGERSCLFFEAIRIVKEMRDRDRAAGRTGVDIRPRFLVWENVPGAFSSNQGEDFRSVLEALGGIAEDGVSIPRPPKGKWQHAGCVVGDGWSIAWRLYDAQYWGVPQRRKRIYLIADLASERAGEILFERESLCGDPAEGGEAREGIADHAEGGAGGGCGVKCLNPWDAQSIRQYDADGIYPTLNANATGGLNRQGVVAAFKGGQGPKAGSIGYQEGQAPTLTSANSGTNTVPDVVYQNTGIGWWNESKVAETLRTPCGGDSTKANLVVYDCRGNGDGIHVPTLTGDHQNRVTDYTALCVGNGPMCNITMQEISNALDCMHDQQAVLMQGRPPRKYIVRRLTPLECCRLQGFPDWWEDGVEGSDSARYKMWGNGIALPCAVDVLRRIAKTIKEEST